MLATIRARLLAAVGILSALVIAFAGFEAWSAFAILQSARQAEAINRTGDLLLQAAGAWAVERGTTNAVLAASSKDAATPAQRQTIAAKRTEADGALEQVLAGLSDPVDPALREALSVVGGLRGRVDALSGPAPADLRREWFPAISALILRSQEARLRAERDLPSGLPASVRSAFQFKAALWQMSEFAGRERGLLAGVIAGGKPLLPGELEAVARARGEVDSAWRLIAQQRDAHDAAIAAAVDAIERGYGDALGKVRSAALDASARGEPYPMTAGAWFAAATEGIETILAAQRTASESLRSGLSDGVRSATLTLAGVGALLVVLTAVAAAAIWFVLSGVSRPLARMTGAMAGIARGDWTVEVPGVGRADEIGAMAAAVQVFRENGRENARLRADQEALKLKVEADRIAAEERLDREIGQVVEAAAAGDLSRRVDTAGKEGFMLRLAGNTNLLIDTAAGVLREVGQVQAALADGDLTRRIDRGFVGSFGTLERDTNRVVARLSETVALIARSAGDLSAAAGEIAADARDLSERTEQNASGLEQTNAALEQLTSTVEANADNARQVRQLATTAHAAVEHGNRIAGDGIEAVRRIERSAARITEFVGVIEEIAFQTSILALNATVEAARAGDAGRGFAVVAQEVRHLAQRASEASRQVDVTVKQSLTDVLDGVARIESIGAALTEVRGQVAGVAERVAEIAAASAEQATTVREIGSAIFTMDATTHRNSTLVEESTAAAHRMEEKCLEMNDLVGRFRLA